MRTCGRVTVGRLHLLGLLISLMAAGNVLSRLVHPVRINHNLGSRALHTQACSVRGIRQDGYQEAQGSSAEVVLSHRQAALLGENGR